MNKKHTPPAVQQEQQKMQQATQDMQSEQNAMTVVAKNDKATAHSAEIARSEPVFPVDFRRVQHGQGPCSCCGPYSE